VLAIELLIETIVRTVQVHELARHQK